MQVLSYLRVKPQSLGCFLFQIGTAGEHLSKCGERWKTRWIFCMLSFKSWELLDNFLRAVSLCVYNRLVFSVGNFQKPMLFQRNFAVGLGCSGERTPLLCSVWRLWFQSLPCSIIQEACSDTKQSRSPQPPAYPRFIRGPVSNGVCRAAVMCVGEATAQGERCVFFKKAKWK